MFRAVWDHAAVIGKTLIYGVVGKCDLLSSGLPAASVWVDTVEVCGAESVGANTLTVRVLAALRSWVHLITDNIGAVHIAGPVTYRPIGILIADIKHQGPTPLTQLIFTDIVLTVSTLNQASFPSGTTLPESAAV